MLAVKRYAMKTMLTISGICLVMSLLGLLTLSTMSVAPSGEAWRRGLLSAHALFFAGWLALALWAKRRVRVDAEAKASTRVTTAVLALGVVYVVLVVLCSIG